jgi:hypothetical protein
MILLCRIIRPIFYRIIPPPLKILVVRSQKWGQIFAQIIRGQIFYPYLTRIIRPWDYDGYLFGGGV